MRIEKAFGSVLKKTRKRQGLTQVELAASSGLDRTFISLLERGERQPSLGSVIKLASVLDVSASEMVANVEAALRRRTFRFSQLRRSR